MIKSHTALTGYMSFADFKVCVKYHPLVIEVGSVFLADTCKPLFNTPEVSSMLPTQCNTYFKPPKNGWGILYFYFIFYICCAQNNPFCFIRVTSFFSYSPNDPHQPHKTNRVAKTNTNTKQTNFQTPPTSPIPLISFTLTKYYNENAIQNKHSSKNKKTKTTKLKTNFFKSH